MIDRLKFVKIKKKEGSKHRTLVHPSEKPLNAGPQLYADLSFAFGA